MEVTKKDLLPNDKLLEKGVDSIDYIKVTLKCEDVFSFEFADYEINSSKYEIVQDLTNIIMKKMSLCNEDRL